MRILLDQGTPVALQNALDNHTVATTYERNWQSLTNGDLLRIANTEFDVFVTTDQNLYPQQNLDQFSLAILVLPFANWPKLKTHIATIVAAIDKLKSGDYVELKLT